MIARAYLSYDVDAVSDATGLDAAKCDPKQDVQAAHQEFKDECDINVIISRYEEKRIPIPPSQIEAAFGDFSDSKDFHAKMNAIHEAHEAFMELPAKIRSRFENDPGQLLEFLNEPGNRKEAIELGLVDGDSIGNAEMPSAEAKKPVTKAKSTLEQKKSPAPSDQAPE